MRLLVDSVALCALALLRFVLYAFSFALREALEFFALEDLPVIIIWVHFLAVAPLGHS